MGASRSFDQVSAIVFARERDRRAAVPIHEVGENAVITRRTAKEVEHVAKAPDRLVA